MTNFQGERSADKDIERRDATERLHFQRKCKINVARIFLAAEATLLSLLLFGNSAALANGNAIAATTAHAAQPQPQPQAQPKAKENVLMKAMRVELNRSFNRLKKEGPYPLYFLAYRVYDIESMNMTARFGALDSLSTPAHFRQVQIEARVGNPKLDNTHPTPGVQASDLIFEPHSPVPIDDDEMTIRHSLWLETDVCFKVAQDKLEKIKGNKELNPADDYVANCFSMDTKRISTGAPAVFKVDQNQWRERVRKLSAIFKKYPFINTSSVNFVGEKRKRSIVTSEGTQVYDESTHFGVYMNAEVIADDGMKLWLYENLEGPTLADVSDQATLESMVLKLVKGLDGLRKAPVAEPYSGPAILRGKAAGVFFHEVLGHRLEGDRQKSQDDGRTFAEKINHRIMPEFMSVTDDPNIARIGTTPLNGAYKYDDEGIPAMRTVLVDHGKLKGFLMCRTPIKGFPKSNGHGRAKEGNWPVARQGNLLVTSDRKVPVARLRQMLINEVRRQKKPYGLIFDVMAGGSTLTDTKTPQSFTLLPLRVTKVFANGHPDVLLRGVNIVGTPLSALEKVIATSDDTAVFNGYCGAESGWIPVSAVAPSMLLQTIEVERQEPTKERPPVLPPPTQTNGSKTAKQEN